MPPMVSRRYSIFFVLIEHTDKQALGLHRNPVLANKA